MSARLAAPSFTDRLVPRRAAEFPTAPASQAPRAAPAAPSGSSLGGAAFCHFTESCPNAPGQDATAPADPTSSAGAVSLSEASAFILSLIAAHEGRSMGDTLAALIAAAGEAIGIPALLSRGADDIEDLAALPGYARRAANRFRSGGP
ncbi:hypothetical protein [Mesorhizobium sp. B1-1-2]|uniref:hypothetical protein n=1 Tax=Mesorhizobium sp. B1-1-2 TaxID=2589982 RepID=UPI0011291AA2|nr:hypothetical protein [Mesorhizobium sp. B1-1-2]TPN79989.1 hypothetical protein FJ985_01790 [Mesorhizobium sp. B1-1-2]